MSSEAAALALRRLSCFDHILDLALGGRPFKVKFARVLRVSEVRDAVIIAWQWICIFHWVFIQHAIFNTHSISFVSFLLTMIIPAPHMDFDGTIHPLLNISSTCSLACRVVSGFMRLEGSLCDTAPVSC